MKSLVKDSIGYKDLAANIRNDLELKSEVFLLLNSVVGQLFFLGGHEQRRTHNSKGRQSGGHVHSVQGLGEVVSLSPI